MIASARHSVARCGFHTTAHANSGPHHPSLRPCLGSFCLTGCQSSARSVKLPPMWVFWYYQTNARSPTDLDMTHHRHWPCCTCTQVLRSNLRSLKLTVQQLLTDVSTLL